MNITKDINNNPLTIGKCYKNIGRYVKQSVVIRDNTYLGRLNEIEGIYGSSDPRFAGRNKIYIFENNNKLDEYFLKKQNIKFKEVSCDDLHSELLRYSSNDPLKRTSSLTQPPKYEEPKKYEPPPPYEKKTLGNTLGKTFADFKKVFREKSPPYSESGGKKKLKKKKKYSRKTKKRINKKTSKRKTSKY